MIHTGEWGHSNYGVVFGLYVIYLNCALVSKNKNYWLYIRGQYKIFKIYWRFYDKRYIVYDKNLYKKSL